MFKVRSSPNNNSRMLSLIDIYDIHIPPTQLIKMPFLWTLMHFDVYFFKCRIDTSIGSNVYTNLTYMLVPLLVPDT